MIEFKAECGHTVRAKDGAAGGTVRCSYCGCDVEVPGAPEDGLDFLFKDVEQQPEAPSGRERRKRRKPKRASRDSSARRFDPFSVILQMCYVALLLIVVIVVGRTYVLPLFETGGVSKRVASPPAQQQQRDTPSSAPAEPAQVQHTGLIADSTFMGLFVASSPPGATVYCTKETSVAAEDEFDANGERVSLRVAEGDDVVRGRANGEFMRLEDGRYVVEMVLPWSDPRLNDSNLPNHGNYIAFRRAIEAATDEQSQKLLDEYFVPDGADAVFIDRTPEQIYLVRRYNGVEVRGGKSKGVRSLFLPKITAPGHPSFSIAPLVAHYLPETVGYGFVETHVRSELDFWEVPAADRFFVIDALRRIGIVPYVTPDGRTRLFKIGIEDGVLATLVIRDAKP